MSPVEAALAWVAGRRSTEIMIAIGSSGKSHEAILADEVRRLQSCDKSELLFALKMLLKHAAYPEHESNDVCVAYDAAVDAAHKAIAKAGK